MRTAEGVTAGAAATNAVPGRQQYAVLLAAATIAPFFSARMNPYEQFVRSVAACINRTICGLLLVRLVLFVCVEHSELHH